MSSRRILSLMGLAFGIFYSSNLHATPPVEPQAAIGAEIADLSFKDIRSLERNLSELGSHRAYVFAFTTTQCPLVKRYLPKLVDLSKKYQDQDVVFVAVNVGPYDTIRDMASQAIDFDAPFTFVKDYDLSCAMALGATRTPQVVVLDQEHRLRYRGRIDDQIRLGGALPQASRNDLDEALNELLADEPISVPETPVDGCVITPHFEKPSSTNLTYHQDIAPIFAEHCARCHHPDSAAPFSLLTFEQVASNAQMIAEVVRDETMPPWYANNRHGVFQNDASLSMAEKNKLLNWIAAGQPVGEVDEDEPTVDTADFSTKKWRIGEPDLVVSMLEQHTIQPTGFIPYKYVVLPHLFIGETWVEAFEIRPENRAVVHHCNLAYMTSEGASDETFITGYVPGGQPLDLSHFSAGAAYRIPAGAALVLQIHYTTTGVEEKSRIQVGLRFPRENVKKRLHHFVLDPRGWKITPHDPAFAITSSHTLKHDADLLGLFTHMHVRGRDMTFYATPPEASQETLLQIPNYNFEWQLGYEIKPGTKILPKGTVVSATAHFDNSAFNPYNPDPDKSVEYGPQTVDEMFNGFVFYVDDDEQLDIPVNPKTGRVIQP